MPLLYNIPPQFNTLFQDIYYKAVGSAPLLCLQVHARLWSSINLNPIFKIEQKWWERGGIGGMESL